MKGKLGYRWKLRLVMAQQGMFATTDLVPLLAERGVKLSVAQVYRLVAQTPERLNLITLVALCDILGCGPSDLIEPFFEQASAKEVGSISVPPNTKVRSPRRADITKP